MKQSSSYTIFKKSNDDFGIFNIKFSIHLSK